MQQNQTDTTVNPILDFMVNAPGKERIVEQTARDLATGIGMSFDSLGSTAQLAVLGVAETLTEACMLLRTAIPDEIGTELVVSFCVKLLTAGKSLQAVKTMPANAPAPADFEKAFNELSAQADQVLAQLEDGFANGAIPIRTFASLAFIAGQKFRAETSKLNRQLIGDNAS